MKFKHCITGGCGSTVINLQLQDNKFKILFKDHWMGSDKLDIIINGTYANNDNNNYYFLDTTEILNGDKSIEFDAKLTFEFIILNMKEIINDNDKAMEFIIHSTGDFSIILN